jgi:hypothetical protein
MTEQVIKYGQQLTDTPVTEYSENFTKKMINQERITGELHPDYRFGRQNAL